MNLIKETADFLKSKLANIPEIGIVLGSGLGGLADKISDPISFPYKEIPNFPVSTVEGHSGKLIFGKLGGKNVVAMQGRFHYYEGYGMKEVTFPIRVLKLLGVKDLFVSNAAGGLNPEFRVGDIMVITDHINFFPENPLRGKNFDELGVRFPDMGKAYHPELRALADRVAAKEGIFLRKGVYIGSTGPTLETQAEYRLFRFFGADATGMSTVPEVIVANHQEMRCFGLSVITNAGEKEDLNDETTHDEVQNVAGSVEPIMTRLIVGMIEQL